MEFKDFNNIVINNQAGVSRVGQDTKIISKHARKIKFKKALDIGTGTGFIPIYLNSLGFQCDGVDKNPKAIECAIKNSKANNAKINFYVSDLFENLKGKFGLIIFSVPLGSSRSSFFTKYLELLKSILPKSLLLSKIGFQLTKNQRINLINRFLNKVPNFIANHGKVLIFLHDSELRLLREYRYSIVDKYLNMKLILLEPN